MRVKITEETGVREQIGDRFVVAEHEDVITVPDEVGARWCGLGWCEDVSGKVATGERKAGAVRIQPDAVKHTAAKKGK